MKIAMLTEYFYPFDRGGSEISVQNLSSGLSKKCEVLIITPNYGSKAKEKIGKTKIIRFPFYKKLSNKKAFFSPIITNNLIWFIYSAYWVIKITKKEKIGIIHIQSKSFILGAYLANLILRKPMVVTFRDYQPICNLGFCLLNKDKSCSVAEYLFRDIPYFLKYYTNNSIKQKAVFPIIALRARLMDKFINLAAKSIKNKICISERQKNIYAKNGFRDIQVIYNSVNFKKFKTKKTSNKIIYVGKLTPAKGILPVVEEILKAKKINFKITIIGKGILESTIKEIVNSSRKGKFFKFISYLDHNQVLKEIATAKLMIVPSVWQEPFGRVAIEALSAQTPLVVSKVGGLPEIVKDGVYGRVMGSNPKNFVKAIWEVYENSTLFQKNIISDYKNIFYKYNSKPLSEYIYLYKQMVNK